MAGKKGMKGGGGNRPGAGNKTRKERGLEPTVQVRATVEKTVADDCKRIHGSHANALRYAAKSKKKS